MHQNCCIGEKVTAKPLRRQWFRIYVGGKPNIKTKKPEKIISALRKAELRKFNPKTTPKQHTTTFPTYAKQDKITLPVVYLDDAGDVQCPYCYWWNMNIYTPRQRYSCDNCHKKFKIASH